MEETDISQYIEQRIHALVLRMQMQQAMERKCSPEMIDTPTGLRVRLLLNNVGEIEKLMMMVNDG